MSRKYTGWPHRALRNIGIYSLPFLVIGVLIGYSFIGTKNNKAVYVDSIRLYNEFDMQNEYEQRFESLQNNRSAMLDSLRMQVESLGRQLSVQSEPDPAQVQYFEQLRQSYFEKEQLFNDELNRVAQSYDEQIWAQLNQYVREFGLEKGIDFIHGANGDGSLMFGSEEKEITDQLIAFANSRYQGNPSP